MKNFCFQLQVSEGEIKETLDRLQTAVQEIYDCYSKLEQLGLLIIKETATDGNQ